MTEAPPTLSDKPDPTTLSGQAASEILRRIESLELAPGAVFTERDLAAQLNMGKAPVREALLRVSAAGLVTPRTGSGYTITPITLKSARDLFEAWSAVESAAVAAMLRRVDAEWTGQMRKVNVELRKHPELQGPVAKERYFHLFVLVGAQNNYLTQLFPTHEVARVLNLVARFGPSVTCADGSHDALLDAIDNKDPDAPELARRAVEELGRRVVDAMISADKLQGINLGEP